MSDDIALQLDPTSSEPGMTRRGLLAAGAAGAAARVRRSRARRGSRAVRVVARRHARAGTVSFGSNGSDPVPKAAYAAVFKAFTKTVRARRSRSTPSTTTRSRSRSTRYLQGRPQDVFTWFAGYRMQFFAQKGLLTPIDDVWETLKPHFSPAMQAASKGLDGHYYFVPIYNYPWAVFYRKSVFKAERLQGPEDLGPVHRARQEDEGRRPDADRVHRQGRLAGDGHVRHPQHADQRLRLPRPPDGAARSRGTAPKVKAVFNHWRELLPYYSQGALGLTWEEGAQQLINKQAGMYLLGSFVGQQATKPADHADLDFFPYPVINPKYGQDSLDAPIDGFLMAKKAKNVGRREAAARRTSAAPPRRTSTSRPTRTTSARATSTPARRTTTRCRRRRPR